MKKGHAWALAPIGLFLALFIGYGIWNGNDFYQMPAIAGFVTALVFAFLMNTKVRFYEKLEIVARGMADENVMIMCLVFVLAGAFSGSVSAAGGATAVVNFGLSVLPGNIVVAGIFLIGCFISTSMGTSVGTITVLAPIAMQVAERTGFPVALCIGASVCGAMFGDNLSMISDTTIAAVKTQGCEMKDKFRENFKIVLPAALLTVVIFWVVTRNGSFQMTEELPYHVAQVIPYLVVLVGALIGINVFVVLVTGTVLSLVIGVATGSLAAGEMFTAVGDGVTGMYDITVISIVVACIVSLVRE